MLSIVVGAEESFDEEKQEFVQLGGTVLHFEHSLASLSKWESIWEKPFLGPEPKTTDETLSYVIAMCVTEDLPPGIFRHISVENLKEINKYIDAKMTATWFNDKNAPKANSTEVITAELVYYWMVALNIPFECQHWHLNRLLTLIKVCNLKNQPEKKMPMRDIAAENRALNAQRKAQLKTHG